MISTTELINIVGTAAFTVSGYLVGIRKRLDILGVVIVSLLTAIGGGMVRDVLVGRIPQIFTQNTSLVVIFVTLLAARLFSLERSERRILATWFIVADAAGLAAFSITGAQVGLHLHLNLFGVILLAFVTAVGGGILRDILVNDVPMILRKDFYGSIAILIGFFMYVLKHVGLLNPVTTTLMFAGGLVLRLYVHRYGIGLPTPHSIPARRGRNRKKTPPAVDAADGSKTD